jgi:DNA-binding Xre family transcriptional regulator
MQTMPVKWKLKEYLDQHDITPYRLAQEVHGELSQKGVYRLVDQGLGGVRFDTLSAVIKGLRTITGREVTPNELLEYRES